MKHVDIYTDGACSGNPGPGGWAAVLIYNNIKKEISGYEKDTTNNRMELLAPIKALSILNQPCDVNIYTDSAYVFNAFDKAWLQKWQKNGWKTSSKQPVQNKELWEQLITFANIHNIKWIKVKGHSDNEINNRCDELARNAISENKKDG
ncbi:MAG: ribonuclease HI [Xylanivirga thermophila]|jgi:ribonuclease HI|uniref:ribonuclease HI n=1 Tax=Xylanivirga thermophila TaxID=2496273 RepID=UPI00101C0D84|nr:ribonuclease HI [Xylanivirga thermophila]